MVAWWVGQTDDLWASCWAGMSAEWLDDGWVALLVAEWAAEMVGQWVAELAGEKVAKSADELVDC